MTKQLNFFFTLLLFSFAGVAQEDKNLDSLSVEIYETYQTPLISSLEEDIVPMGMARKTDFSMEVGTVFSTSGDKNWQNTTYFAPHIEQKITDKFSLSFGASIAQSFYIPGGPTIEGNENTYPYFAAPSLIYASGRFQVNEKLALHAGVYKTFTLHPASRGNAFEIPDSWGVNVGAKYQINENSFIQLDLNYSRSDGYYPNSSIFGDRRIRNNNSFLGGNSNHFLFP